MSAANTECAEPLFVSISTRVQEGSAVPSFSYHAMVLLAYEAVTISISPSPSMSAA